MKVELAGDDQAAVDLAHSDSQIQELIKDLGRIENPFRLVVHATWQDEGRVSISVKMMTKDERVDPDNFAQFTEFLAIPGHCDWERGNWPIWDTRIEIKSQPQEPQKPLAERLNEACVVPDVRKGKVFLQVEEMVDQWADVDLDYFGITDGYIEAHPEGSDRGGWVPTVFDASGSAYYNENGGMWI